MRFVQAPPALALDKARGRALPCGAMSVDATAQPRPDVGAPAPSASRSEPGRAGGGDDRMPKGIPFIVANEFAERFCYYGINAILTVFMTDGLLYGHAAATARHSLFKSGAYFFPLVGAIVSDVFWGKFRTIM